MKIVINACYGGFSLSEAAVLRYLELLGKQVWPEPGTFSPTYWLVPPSERLPKIEKSDWRKMPLEERIAYNHKLSSQTFYDRDIPRDDAALVQVVEEMGDKANGMCAALKVVEIPGGVEWEIDEYDGMESVDEAHRSWS